MDSEEYMYSYIDLFLNNFSYCVLDVLYDDVVCIYIMLFNWVGYGIWKCLINVFYWKKYNLKNFLIIYILSLLEKNDFLSKCIWYLVVYVLNVDYFFLC